MISYFDEETKNMEILSYTKMILNVDKDSKEVLIKKIINSQESTSV